MRSNKKRDGTLLAHFVILNRSSELLMLRRRENKCGLTNIPIFIAVGLRDLVTLRNIRMLVGNGLKSFN